MGLIEKFGDLLDKWPGKEHFGNYRFLPIFFFSGAAVEFLMIHWRPNGVNFCKGADDTYKAKKAKEKALERCNVWREVEAACKK